MEALDRLETDVASTEELLRTEQVLQDIPPADPWTPPEGLGPLPLDLRPRADRILARQLAAAESVARAIAVNRRQAALTNKIELFDNGGARPSYLDQAI